MESRALEPTPSFYVLSRSQPATCWGKCELKKRAAQQPRSVPILQYCSGFPMANWVTTSVIELVYRLTDRIAAEIQRLRPDALITWGPEGGTGHPDHRLVSELVTQLVRAG